MRMWMVDPKLLCKQHLLGEHFELHKFYPSFKKQHGITRRRGQIEPMAMATRHDELVDEMVRRGMNHKSPYEMPKLSYLPLADLYGTVDRDESLEELCRRCPACKERIEGGNEQR